jgi:hypothetical protein
LYSHFATAIVVVTTWETHMKLIPTLLLAVPLAANAYCPITNDWRANAQCQQEEYRQQQQQQYQQQMLQAQQEQVYEMQRMRTQQQMQYLQQPRY